MSFLSSVFKFSFFILLISIGYKYYKTYSADKLVEEIAKWADENRIKIDKSAMKMAEFSVAYDENEWKSLVGKLESTRYFQMLNEKQARRFEYGFDPEYARELVDYWRTKFDWKKQVNFINKYKQFKIAMNGTNIHFVREIIQPDNFKGDVIKLVLMDGWPGSFFGFYALLDHLNEMKNKNNVALDIIVPSIPGYGYSTPLDRPVDSADTAQLFDTLMRYLHGEDVKYFVHGEDWGSIVATNLAQLYPDRVRGIHLTMPISAKGNDLEMVTYLTVGHFMPSLVFTPAELANNFTQKSTIWNKLRVILAEAGYMHLQATKPDTLGHALTDSPIGLMAYILEKYSSWTFDQETQIFGYKDGGLNKYDRDQLLRIITYYWMSNSITSSVRFYKNYFLQYFAPYPKPTLMESKISKKVACAVQIFDKELISEPQIIVQLRYQNLKRFTVEPEGGHFAAFENPIKSSQDLIAFIKSCL